MSGNSPIKLLNCILILLGMLLSLAGSGFAQTNLVTPAQWLALQSKPQFKPGHRLPHLTRWGWTLSSNATVELARNWGYALTLSGYATPTVASNVTKPGTFDYGMAQLARNYSNQFKLSVLIDRTFTNPPPDFYCTNASGQFVNRYGTGVVSGAVVSPEGGDAYWKSITDYWMSPLRAIQSNAPISIVLNGGEYGLDVAGFGLTAWAQDPRVQAATNGFTIPRYSSNRKAHQLGFLTRAIEQDLPDRDLYIFYHTGVEQYRVSGNESYWGWNSDVLVTNTDLPSFEAYYENTWTSITNPNVSDILLRYLNAVGYSIKLGHRMNYSWVCGGWTTNAERLSDIPRYTGFLKCLYTAGTVGAVAGFFSMPAGGFDVAFPSNAPPHWLQQMTALARVHAQFSYLENYIWNGALLDGSKAHYMQPDQPAYEFTNTVADVSARVVARKLNTANEWLITAWAAVGSDRTVTVTIPTLGQVGVLVSAAGSVYRATPDTLTRLNEVGLPSASLAPPRNLRVAHTNAP
jgi:hypothetical protein